jgi:AcrR family transcriptional regulator
VATETRETRRQADRSRETRRKLMEATVECLVERGWAGTTTTVVAERAGVSRGAQLHHFRTRGELVAAAVEHLGVESVLHLKELARQVDGGSPKDRITAVVELIADFHASDLFTAALELWVAARTDPDLKTVVVPLEVRLGRETHRLAVELLDADETKPGVREAVQITMDLVRGLALANQLTDDAKRRKRIIRHWAQLLEDSL